MVTLGMELSSHEHLEDKSHHIMYNLLHTTVITYYVRWVRNDNTIVYYSAFTITGMSEAERYH